MNDEIIARLALYEAMISQLFAILHGTGAVDVRAIISEMKRMAAAGGLMERPTISMIAAIESLLDRLDLHQLAPPPRSN